MVGMNEITYNRTSNVHQTNKKVQGHDKQNQIKMPTKGETRPFDSGVQCMRAGNPKTVKEGQYYYKKTRKEDARSDGG